MIRCIKWNVAYESREVMICLYGIVETVSLILCPVLGPLVQEIGGHIGHGSMDDCQDGLLWHKTSGEGRAFWVWCSGGQALSSGL